MDRRQMLRLAAAGGSVGAAALAAPSIAGIGAAPAYAQSGSDCEENLTAPIMTGEIQVFGFTVPPSTNELVVSQISRERFAAVVNIPGVETLLDFEVGYAVSMSNGDVIEGTLNPLKGAKIEGELSIPRGVPVLAASVDAMVLGTSVNLPIVDQMAIVNCSSG